MTLSFILAQNFGCNSSVSQSCKKKKDPCPSSSLFLIQYQAITFRRNHLKDNQFHRKCLGLQQFSMSLAAMTSVNVYCCCSVPPSVFYNSVAETILLTAYWVQYCISVGTAIMDILCSPEQYAWEPRKILLCVCVCVNSNCSDLYGFIYTRICNWEKWTDFYRYKYIKKVHVSLENKNKHLMAFKTLWSSSLLLLKQIPSFLLTEEFLGTNGLIQQGIMISE